MVEGFVHDPYICEMMARRREIDEEIRSKRIKFLRQRFLNTKTTRDIIDAMKSIEYKNSFDGSKGLKAIFNEQIDDLLDYVEGHLNIDWEQIDGS